MATKDGPPRASGVSKRGFASMTPERQREIARKGGASVPPGKRSFSTDRGLAVQAGRKGGEISRGRVKPPDEPRRPQDDFGIHPLK